MIQENLEKFFGWINERHRIYVKRRAGDAAPWTEDEILRTYKFTNVFRELDRTTVWMRKNWTNPNHNSLAEEVIFNCCVFRMFGTMEFAEAHGWVNKWNPNYAKALARNRLNSGKKVFTGAYIITNQGSTDPKEVVVVDRFLNPVWENRKFLADIARETNSLEQMHKALGAFPGWGGGGFMAYEVVTDLNHTPVLALAKDRYTWANAGPGAKRGLNRIHGRELNNTRGRDWNAEMYELLQRSDEYLGNHIPRAEFDMRAVEHSLCEWDKYMRVLLGQGKPRSLFKPTL
jgi:hypothetical protein